MTFGGKNSFLAILFLLFIFNLRCVSYAIEITPKKQLRYAVELMKQKEYELSASELLRFIYFFNDHPLVPKAYIFLAICYIESGKYQKAKDTLNTIKERYFDTSIYQDALFLEGICLFKEGNLRGADSLFKELIDLSKRDDIRSSSLWMRAWIKAREAQWDKASNLFKEIKGNNLFISSSLLLSDKILEGKSLPKKDPKVSGLLALLIPGLGHLYCNRPKDALLSFTLNGAFIGATIEAFRDGNDFLGGIFSFLELGWYAGNIYSAVNCAHKYNRKIQEDFLGRFYMGDEPRIKDDKIMFLSIRWEF